MALALQATVAAGGATIRHTLLLDCEMSKLKIPEVASALAKAFPNQQIRTLPVTAARPSFGTVMPYAFPRNLLAAGKEKMVLIDEDALLTRQTATAFVTSATLRGYLEAYHIEYVALPYWVSLANLHYDHDLDLLVIAHTESGPSRCNSPSFFLHASCDDVTSTIGAAFGKPDNVLQLVSNHDERQANGGSSCYDLDLFFHMATNRSGKKVALVYKPCIEEHPRHGRMARKTFLEQLGGMGVAIVEIGRDDFKNLAANAVSLENGRMLFCLPVSDSLRHQLAAHGIDAVHTEQALCHQGDKKLDAFGLHCLTTEVVQRRKGGIGSTGRTEL